tara:strand:+ start:397 stop:528 length:132 start_codon:yes stop_codon:yes gene_type:complete
MKKYFSKASLGQKPPENHALSSKEKGGIFENFFDLKISLNESP